MLNSNGQRLHLFTGKGGVGKTTCSLSYAHFLKNFCHKKVKHISLSTPQIPTHRPLSFENLQSQTNVDCEFYSLEQSILEYVSEKVKSQTLASWITNRKLFIALINMLPNFGYLIFLGKILQELTDDPQLHLVVDCPASGHFKVFIDTPEVFFKAFEQGALFQDTQKVLKTIQKPDFMIIWNIALPTSLSVHESIELYRDLPYYQGKFQFLINQCITDDLSNDDDHIPSFVKARLDEEQRAIKQLQSYHPKKLTLISEASPSQQVTMLATSFHDMMKEFPGAKQNV